MPSFFCLLRFHRSESMRCERSMHESLRDLRPEMGYSWYMGGIGSDGFKQLAFHGFVVDCAVVYIGLRRHGYAQTAHAAEVRDAAAAHKAALQEVPHTFKSLRFVIVSPFSEYCWSKTRQNCVPLQGPVRNGESRERVGECCQSCSREASGFYISELVHGGNNSTNPGCFHFNPVRHATEVRSLNAALESERKELESARLEADEWVLWSEFFQISSRSKPVCLKMFLQSSTIFYISLQSFTIYYMILICVFFKIPFIFRSLSFWGL